jgi:hypothetical protein
MTTAILWVGLLLRVALVPGAAAPTAMPALYDGDRYFVQPVTSSGQTLTFYTDTGGGLFIYRDSAERFGLKITNAAEEGKEPFYVASLPTLRADATIPLPEWRQGRLPVIPRDAKSHEFSSKIHEDGMLGQEWFAEHIWTFDYPKKRLLLRAPGDAPKVTGPHRVELGFQKDEKGERALDFPRIRAEIDGTAFDLLLDTGATVELSETAAAALKDRGPRIRATSFIVASTFDDWTRRHPDWRVIRQADEYQNEPMIRVPSVKVGGWEVGPVWFTRRADKNFHEFMSRFMDQTIEGALGGNVLRTFRLTIDYPGAAAYFEKP